MYIILLIIFTIVFIVKFIRYLRFRQVLKLFDSGNCIVFGLRGTGKDLLFSNVVAYRNKPYCSNMNYLDSVKNAPVCYPFDPVYIKLGGNTYRNFTENNILPYSYPLPDGCDYYLSDGGVYFPSQECSDLNRRYPSIAMFQALSRHVGNCNFHVNIQNLNRLWDKIREQSDIYIRCISCKVSKRGIVSQKLIVYDRYQSAVDRVEPLKVKTPLLGKAVKTDIALTKANFKAKYGNITKIKVRYKNKGHYDSRRFKKILEGEYEKVS